MDFKAYISPLQKWWWMIAAAGVIAAVVSFFITLGQPAMYQSRTTLIIGQSLTNPNPNSTQFYLEQQLASIYADLATRESVKRDTMAALGLSFLPEYTVRALPETQLIEITVADSDPVRAQAVTAELANQLILRAPTNAEASDSQRQDFIDAQLTSLETNIEQTQAEIDKLKVELGNLNSASDISRTQQEITSLEGKLNTLQDNYARLLSNTQQGALNTLTVVEAAEVPTLPVGPNRAMTVLITALIGFGLAAIAAYAIEWLDQTVHSTEEVGRILQAPLLAEIPKIPDDIDALGYVNDQPFSPITDSFRSLRSNIEFLGLGQKTKTLLITSPGDSEGKTTIAVNLALSLAKTRKRVIVIDADFYRSELDEKFGLSNKKGLGDTLMDGRIIKEYLIPLFKNQVYLLPSGTTPPNPSEQLGSIEMSRTLETLKEVADVIIVDGPPFIVSDSLALSAKMDGVLIVVSPGKSRRDLLQKIKVQMERAHASILGYAANGVAQKSSYYYSHYYRSNKPQQHSAAQKVSSTPLERTDKNGEEKPGSAPVSNP